MVEPVRKFLKARSASSWFLLLAMLTVSELAANRLAESQVWISLRVFVYQALTDRGLANVPLSSFTVLLDDTDYWKADPNHTSLEGRIPTNRAYLGRLVEQLDAADAPVIAIDVDLRSPNGDAADLPAYKTEDETFFAAIRAACVHGRKIVLASELLPTAQGPTEVANIYDAQDFGGCVHKGYITLPLDIRRAPGAVTLANGTTATPFSLAAAAQLPEVGDASLVEREQSASRIENAFPYSRYMPEAAFRSHGDIVSGADLLAASPVALRPRLQKRVALIGAAWHSLAYSQGSLVDQHHAPSGSLPGVLLHANYLEAALNGGLLKPFPELLVEVINISLVLLLVVIGACEIHWAWKWGSIMTASLFVLVFSYFLAQRFGSFLDFFFPLAFLGLHAAYEHVSEWRSSPHKEHNHAA